MKDAQRPERVSLSSLIERLKDGRFAIPEFQRDFEWTPSDVRDLIRSIFLDYYIGTLLLWRGKKENFDALACEPIYGQKTDSVAHAEHIVLDGQQRLTAIYYTFAAPPVTAPGRANRFRYFIKIDKFMDEAYDDAFHYHWTQWGHSLLDDPDSQYEHHIFPLSVLGQGQGGFELYRWSDGYVKYWDAKADEAQTAGHHESAEVHRARARAGERFRHEVNEIAQKYQVAYIELERDLAIDRVCEIFTQINSKGIRLDIFDLVNALVRPKGVYLKKMWQEAANSLTFVQTDRMNVYLLQVMSVLLQDGYCSPKYLYYLLPGQSRAFRQPDGSLIRRVLVSDADDFIRLWRRAVVAVQRAIERLVQPQQYGVVSAKFLPYASILPAFAALQDVAGTLEPALRMKAFRKLATWYWASVFTSRYSGSVESTTAKDFTAVRSWFLDDAAEPQLIGEFKKRFRDLPLQSEVKPGTSVYNGFFNLLVVNGARDWLTDEGPAQGDRDDHHIIPQRFGREWRLGTRIDSILNRTPLAAETNRNVIGDRLPNQYLPEWIATNGTTVVREILQRHLISPRAFDILTRSPFGPKDFEEFIAERDRSMKDAIEDLILQERVKLPPRLRELDQEIEEVERGLRALIAEELDHKPELVPSDIRQRARERYETDLRKRPFLDTAFQSTLEGQLQYFDLRDLQQTVVNKENWPRFEAIFGTKEGLATRSTQLAELRNAIRHSRPIDDVLVHDGRAAIGWFGSILRLQAAQAIESPEIAAPSADTTSLSRPVSNS
ncbi:MAG: hypothetical protein DLM67_12220, partial [Candidatus Nephthysia bennettiae]